MIPQFGPLELVIILVIVAMLFGVGKLPEVFGAVGKGVREFRTNASTDTADANDTADTNGADSASSEAKAVTVEEAQPAATESETAKTA